MKKREENIEKDLNPSLSDDDIFEAMKDVQGYLDITPADLKEIYRHAYRHALARITKSVRAREIMTGVVFSVNADTPLREVAELMAEKGVSGVPVLDSSGKVTGVISEKDFLVNMGAQDRKHFMAIVAECLKGKSCLAMPVRSKKAGDIMTSPAVTVTEGETVGEIARLFTEKKINRVPVVDNTSGGLAGIVSRADIVKASLPNTAHNRKR